MRKRVIVVAGISVVVILTVLSYMFSLYGDLAGELKLNASGKKVAVVDVYGEIADTTGILRQLHTYERMNSVRSIVIRINSPGSQGLAASQEVYGKIRKITALGKPVVVSMNNIAASGAYYIASAADKIVANSGTLTGSIGVILAFATAKELMEKIGVNYVTVSSGKYKDIGNFSREATEQEKDVLKELINEARDIFVRDIVDVRHEALAESAGIKEEDIEKRKAIVRKYVSANIADGRIFTGETAKRLGLVDEIGGIDEAIELAAKLAGIDGRPSVIKEKEQVKFADWLARAFSGITINAQIPGLSGIILK
ncbi:MAG: signal peptide peptidase SppA [Candidatus Goldiibacteriota bacterium]